MKTLRKAQRFHHGKAWARPKLTILPSGQSGLQSLTRRSAQASRLAAILQFGVMPAWHKLDAPDTILCIAACGDGRWLLGTSDGLYLLAGQAAEPIAPTLRGVAISALAVDPPHILVGAADGIAYSHDFGASWTYAQLPAPRQVVQLVMSPAFAREGLAFAAAMGGGIWRSQNGGHSWEECNFGLIGREAFGLALAPAFPLDPTVLAMLEDGLFISRTRGESWALAPLDADAHPLSALALLPQVWIAGSERHGLYFSTNRGAGWARRRDFSGGPIAALAASPAYQRVAVARPDGLVAVSADAGESWTRLPRRAPEGVLVLALDDSAALLCGTQHRGLWRYA